MIRQQAFRYRLDDGSETGASWKYGLNTNGLVLTNTNYRMRYLMQEYNGDTHNNYGFKCFYNKNAAGWNEITTTSSVIKAVTSTHLTNNEDCTQQIGAGTFITDNDGVTDDGTVSDVPDFAGNDETEIEIVFQVVDGDVADADVISILWTDSSSTSLDDYTQYVDVIVEKVYIKALVGEFALTGISTGLAADRVLTASAGSFALTGIATGLTADRVLTADTGSFALTGIDVNLDYVSGGYTLTAEVGAFTLTGILSVLAIARKITANVSIYTLIGNNVAFDYVNDDVDEMPIPPLRDGLFGKQTGMIESNSWYQWFTKLIKKTALNPPGGATSFLRGDGTWNTPSNFNNIYPSTDDSYYLGKNDDDSPFSWKGIILKDQAGTGKYYRLEVYNDAIQITDLTD